MNTYRGDTTPKFPKPTSAFVGASWAALLIGVLSYFIGLGNATIGLGEKGYYLVLMLYGLFSVVSLQKTVRDQQQGIPVTNIYYGIAWTAVLSAVALMAIGLWNATFTLSEIRFLRNGFCAQFVCGNHGTKKRPGYQPNRDA